ncbi:MAG: tyrosine-type recombinase/integrase [Reyranella sp.]|uniref:tyrosine-type recombinase/integrase n=1 Tax=Reyranella sp. TaxID=1929291 RepID=UPI003D0F76CE
MGHQVEQGAAEVTVEDIRRIWRADRSVQDSSADHYLQWIKRFRLYCARHGLEEPAELTLSGARRFIAWYAQRRCLDPRRLGGARFALYALSRVYQVKGTSLPAWRPPQPVLQPATRFLREYADHLVRRRGNPAVTVHKKLQHVGKIWEHLAASGKTWCTMALTDIDAFLIGCAERYAPSIVADIAGSVRCLARFLLATGRISTELAESVVLPRRPRFERPRRALPWQDVQRLLRSVDTSSRGDLRDHALLLMMSTYGFGAGEVIRLQLQDIDWTAATLHVVRPKTGVAFTLPLMPAVPKALAFYLRDGRPPNIPHRYVFVRA